MRRALVLTVAPLIIVAAVSACTPVPPPPEGAAYDIRCPVTGTVSFSNDWHAPRSGGLLHEGNDVFAPRGRANVAVVAGTARYRTGTRSGKAIWLDGDDGNDYFYAHFDAWEGTGPERRVAAGEVIGYTGNTGDAASTPTHTHFEIHPAGAGGDAVNRTPRSSRRARTAPARRPRAGSTVTSRQRRTTASKADRAGSLGR